MDKNLKIEFRTFRIIGEEDMRHVAWRVVPSQLNWWQRLFNPWRLLSYVMSDGDYFNWFSLERYKSTKETYHTVGDIIERKKQLKYLSKERRKNIRDDWKNA